MRRTPTPKTAGEAKLAEFTAELAKGSPDDLVPAANGRSHSDVAFGDLIAIVAHAERQVYDAQTAVNLQAELDNARRQMQRREHVDPQIIRAVFTLADAWMLQTGLRDPADENRDGGGS
jgi:hypothetical protein